MINREQQEHQDKFEQYLRTDKKLKGSSKRGYLAHVAKFLAQRAQDAPLAEIMAEEVNVHLEACGRAGNGHRARLNKLMSIREFCRYLIRAGVLAADPTISIDIHLPVPENDLRHSFTREEIFQLLAACDENEEGLRDRVAVIMGAYAGLRCEEILMLNLESIIMDKDEKKVAVCVIKNKAGKNRTIPLWEEASIPIQSLFLARLSHGAAGKDPLLTSYKKNGQARVDNRRLRGCSLDRLLKKLAARAGIKRGIIKTDMLRNAHQDALDYIMDRELAQKRLGEYFESGTTKDEKKDTDIPQMIISGG